MDENEVYWLKTDLSVLVSLGHAFLLSFFYNYIVFELTIVRYLNGINGKCSHGTPDDTSRTFTATGGIYKGRSSQNEAPHSYIHSTAAEVAVKATEYYLIDRGYIISLIYYLKPFLSIIHEMN